MSDIKIKTLTGSIVFLPQQMYLPTNKELYTFCGA